MTDVMQLARVTISPLLTVAIAHEAARTPGPGFCVLRYLNDASEFADNAEITRETNIRADVWSKVDYPVAAMEDVRTALIGAGYTLSGAEGDAAILNGVTYYCLSLQATYFEEVD